MVASNLHELVFQTAKEILANGQYPTMDLICQKLKLTPNDIQAVLINKPEEKQTNTPKNQEISNEMLEAINLLASLSVSHEKEVEISHDSHNNSNSDVLEDEQNLPNHVAEMATRADRKAQYMAGGELVLTQKLYRYYRETQNFSESEIKKEVEAAMEQTKDAWEDDIENFSPAAMLKKYGK